MPDAQAPSADPNGYPEAAHEVHAVFPEQTADDVTASPSR